MSNASQPKTTLASDGPQAAPEAKSKPEQKECKLTREEFMTLFEAARERDSKMTVNEIMKEQAWSPATPVGPTEAMQTLDEIEAANAGSDDDENTYATEKEPRKTSTKHKN